MEWDNYFNRKYKLEDYLGVIWAHSELFDVIIAQKPKTILEVGGGTGIMSIFLGWLGYEVTLCDNNAKVLEQSKELCGQLNGKVTCVLCDAFNLKNNFGNKHFDVVFSQGFLEHFDDFDIKAVVKEQLKVANRVIISVPSMFYPMKDFGNERLLSINRWAKMLKEFDIEFIKYYGLIPSKRSIKRAFVNPSILTKITFNCLFKRSQIIIGIENNNV